MGVDPVIVFSKVDRLAEALYVDDKIDKFKIEKEPDGGCDMIWRFVLVLVALVNFGCFDSGANSGNETEPVAQQCGPPLSPPAASSPELQQVIGDWPAPKIRDKDSIPSTTEDWLEAIQATDQRRAAEVQESLSASNLELERASLAGVDVFLVTPRQVDSQFEGKLFLYVHGGAYLNGNGLAGLREGILIAERLGISLIAVDYRMPPTHPFPAAVDDVVGVYEELIRSRSPAAIAMGGSSAGAGLALASIHAMQEQGLELPAAIYAGTPWADLTDTSDSLRTNRCIDRILVSYEGRLEAAAKLYAGKYDLKNHLISPVYGDFTDFPPTILATGTRDLFLSDTVRTHRKMRAAGVDAELHVYEGMSHAGYFLPAETPESRDLYGEIKSFLVERLSTADNRQGK